MRHSFLRHRAFFGVLMVCVLALGVQGVAEAVTSTGISTNIPGSKTNTSKVEVRAGQEFEITLTFRLTNPSRIKVGSKYMHDGSVTSSSNANILDSSGYFINDNGHRTLNAAGQAYVKAPSNRPTGYTHTLRAKDENNIYTAVEDSDTYYSDRNRYVYNEVGYQVYYLSLIHISEPTRPY